MIPGGDVEPLQGKAAVSLLFAAGGRPSASDVDRLAASVACGPVPPEPVREEPVPAGPAMRISHRPADAQGWLELSSGDGAYELSGLAPARAAPTPVPRLVFDLPRDIGRFGFEAVSLAPGAHLAGGGALLPMARMLIGLAARLARDLPVTAVCWNPACSWMAPRYFGRVVSNWLAGGVFPALGLTGVRRRKDGALESSGLAFFTGQELRVPRRGEEPGSETTQLAARIIDYLVRRGPLERREGVTGPTGEALILEPSPDGRRVTVTRPA